MKPELKQPLAGITKRPVGRPPLDRETGRFAHQAETEQRRQAQAFVDGLRHEWSMSRHVELLPPTPGDVNDVYCLCDRSWRPGLFFNSRKAALELKTDQWFTAYRAQTEPWNQRIAPHNQFGSEFEVMSFQARLVKRIELSEFMRIVDIGRSLKQDKGEATSEPEVEAND